MIEVYIIAQGKKKKNLRDIDKNKMIIPTCLLYLFIYFFALFITHFSTTDVTYKII